MKFYKVLNPQEGKEKRGTKKFIKNGKDKWKTKNLSGIQ